MRKNKLTILCDSQKHITYLDIHCNACLKHFSSSINQSQRNERDEDLLFTSLMPKLTVICHTRSQPWGYGHHPRSSRVQQRTHINVTRPLISTHPVSFVMKYCPISTTLRNPASIQNSLNLSCCDSFSIRSPYYCNRKNHSGQTVRSQFVDVVLYLTPRKGFEQVSSIVDTSHFLEVQVTLGSFLLDPQTIGVQMPQFAQSPSGHNGEGFVRISQYHSILCRV